MVTGKSLLVDSEPSIANNNGLRAFLRNPSNYEYWHGLAEIMYKKLKVDPKTNDLRFIGRCIGERTVGDDDFEALIAQRCNGILDSPAAKQMRNIFGLCCLENGKPR